jgi:hypothetical protein
MIASIKTPDNATKLDGFEFFIVKKSYNGGGTTLNWSVVDTHVICNIATDGNYRSWDTPIHEFGHGINFRMGTFNEASAVCKKYAPFNTAECFAWSSEFWFNTITSQYLKKSIPKQELLNYRTELSNTGVKYVSYFKSSQYESFMQGFINDYYKKYFDAGNTWQPTCVGRPPQ